MGKVILNRAPGRLDVPEIDLECSFRPAMPSSPPPGRPGRDQILQIDSKDMEEETAEVDEEIEDTN